MPKGIKGFQKGHKGFNTEETYKIIGEKTRERMVEICAGGKQPPWLKGKGFKKGHGALASKESYELRAKKISKALLGKPQYHQRGEKNNFWKGGITPINTQIRESLEMKIWKRAVLERDKFKCVLCGVEGVKFHVDHIKPFSLFPELRLALDNGRTLCVPCHKQTDTYLNKAKNYKR